MQHQQAHKIGGEWAEAAKASWPWPDVRLTQDNLITVRLAMRHELERFFPDDIEHAIVATEDDHPAVIALAGDALYWARVESYGPEPPSSAVARLKLRRTSLDAASASVSVTTRLYNAHGTVWREARWEFEIDGDPFVVETETLLDANELPDGEALARALAERVGWTLPAALNDSAAEAAQADGGQRRLAPPSETVQ